MKTKILLYSSLCLLMFDDYIKYICIKIQNKNIGIIIMNEYQNFKRINTLPFRNYYIPFDENEDFSYVYGIIDKKKSSEYIDLNGNWNIKEHNSIDSINIEEELNDVIDVPSCVQMRGYDHIQYINVRTPFPVDPPYVPKENPTYHYRRTININKKENKSYLINFEGVDSCFYLYVNKNYVGFSEITHSLSEFDITNYLVNGINTIDVIVLKWCSGSYLECQDKFRFTGIFRDLYILERPKEHITNYKFKTKENVLFFDNLSNVDIFLFIDNKEYKVNKNESINITIDNVVYWSFENPYLYEMIIKANSEKILENVGFRDIKIDKKVFLINNEKIKLKGINRHEFSPINGATITVDELYKDLMIMKDLNANAIRTCHYPDIPEFYYLTDLLGFYVIDEADLEMHEGAVMHGGYTVDSWQELADNMIFEDAIYDREVSLVERDYNRCSVIIFSMGNEASYGNAFEKGNKYLKEFGNRPVHYEGINNTDPLREYRYSDRIDIASDMYPSVEVIKEKYLNNPRETKPFVLCEYTHAMGNSCGDVKDYWELIYNNDQCMGAFVWEFNDHAILTKDGYKYGGDFNERDHDLNFCCDGLLTPDRKYKSSTYELKAVYQGKMESLVKNIKIPKYTPYSKKIDYKLDYNTGLITNIYIDDKDILVSPMKINFRRYIDNDRIEVNEWNGIQRLHIAKPYVYSYVIDNNKITFNCAIVADCVCPPIKYSISYKKNIDGIDIEIDYKLSEYVKEFPRFGIELEFSKKYQKFTYIGYGPYESYIDKHISCDYNKYNSTAKDNYYHYIMPQESGSHYYTKYVEMKKLLSVTADKEFSFSISPYTTTELINKKHDYELKSKSTVLCLDVNMRGVGTHSCGPQLDEKYKIKRENKNTFKIRF